MEWDESNAASDSWSAVTAKAEELRSKPGATRPVDDGDADAALAAADQRVGAYYTYHFASHAQLEPQNCTAWRHDGIMELWAPTQLPGRGRQAVADLLGLDKPKVTVNQLRGGGGFGRRLHNDFMVEVAAIANRLDVPVKLQWTREDDMSHDTFRAGGFHQVDAGLDADGRITAWRDRFITFSRDGNRPVSGGSLSPRVFPAGVLAKLPLRAGLRWSGRRPADRGGAPGSNVFGFVEQSFIHEPGGGGRSRSPGVALGDVWRAALACRR